jgi:hypothetical protein
MKFLQYYILEITCGYGIGSWCCHGKFSFLFTIPSFLLESETCENDGACRRSSYTKHNSSDSHMRKSLFLLVIVITIAVCCGGVCRSYACVELQNDEINNRSTIELFETSIQLAFVLTSSSMTIHIILIPEEKQQFHLNNKIHRRHLR